MALARASLGEQVVARRTDGRRNGGTDGRTRLPVIPPQSLIMRRKQGRDGKDGPPSGQGVPEERAVAL